MNMVALLDMGRPIRATLEKYAPTLQQLPDQALRDFAEITAAFAQDLRAEVSRREDEEAAKREASMEATYGTQPPEVP